MVPVRRTRSTALAYHVVVGLVGWGVLYAYLNQAPPPEWHWVAGFALLSMGVKSLGFRVARNVTHSLVGIVDLAALYSLGTTTAALVALVSSSVCQIVHGERNRSRTAADRWGPVVFIGGLNVCKAAAAGWAYEAAGGRVPLEAITWTLLLPVLAASVVWFVLDHVGWSVAILLAEGRSGTVRFLRGILPYSLLIELLPLPVAATISTAQTAGGPFFLLAALTVLGVGYVVQTLMVSLSRERRHVRELSIISTVGRELLGSGLNVPTVCELVYRSCLLLVGAPVFALQLREDDPRGCPNSCVALDGGPVKHTTVEGDVLTRVAASRQSLLVRDMRQSDAQPLPWGPPAQSGLYVPVVRGDELLGVIALQSPEPQAFSEDDRAAVELLASQAAIGLQTVRLYERERRRSAQLLAIAEVTRKVAAIQGLPRLFDDTVRLVADTFEYYHVGIFTVDPEARKVTFEAASSAHIQERGLAVDWGVGIVGSTAASATTVVANNVDSDPRFVADTALPETRAEMAVPLVVEDRIVGVLDVQATTPNAFGEDDRFILETLAAQIAIAIEDNRLYEAQQEQAWVSTALQQAAEAVVRATQPEDVLGAVARLTIMLAGVHRCVIFVWSEETQRFTVAAAEGWTREQSRVLRSAEFSPGAIPILDRICHEQQTISGRSEDLIDHLPPALHHAEGRGLLIGLPLRAKGDTVGSLMAEILDSEDSVGEHRLTILSGMANHAALGLDNARLYAAQREEAWVSTTLLQVANTITTSPDVEDTIATVARLVPMLVGVDWSAVVLWDPEERAITLHSTHGLDDGEVRFLLGDGGTGQGPVPIRRILERGEPLILGDADGMGASPDAPALVSSLGAVAGFPMRARARCLGALLAGQRGRAGFSGRNVGILSGIASQAAVAVEAAQLYARTLEQQRLEREIELAREIQVSFLPECCPEVPGWEIAVEWRAAHGAAGDYYDFLRPDDRHLGLVIADVSDKGVAAALYMALSRTVLRAAALDATGPADALERANRVLLEESRSGMFVSIFFGILDVETGLWRYARAGHNPPYWLCASDGRLDALCPPGTVLGVTETPGIVEQEVYLSSGDTVVMYTDGVTDALDGAGNEFGEERLEALVRDSVGLCAADVVRRVDDAVQAFAGSREQFDDFTLLVVRRA